MKNILIIAYCFPPYNGGGMIRIHNFVKYLPKFGFTPLVLTVKEKYHENASAPQLLDEYSKEVKIFRTESLDLKGTGEMRQKICGIKKKSLFDRILFSIIKNKFTRRFSRDRALLWIPYAVWEGRRIFKKEGFDLIFSTSPPFGNNIIAYLLHKIMGRPFVLDYRDDWVGNEVYCSKSHTGQFIIEKKIEHFLVEKAEKVLTVTLESLLLFKEKYPDIQASKYKYLPNGYDPDYFKVNLLTRKVSDKIHFVYAGSFTNVRSPRFFLYALKETLKENRCFKNKIKVTFMGFTLYTYKKLIDTLGLGDVISFIGSLSPRETAKFLQEKANVCLLFQSPTAGETAIPGKVYEYLAARKLILCMDSNGATTKFLEKIGFNLNIDYKDVEGIKHLIKIIVNNYEEVRSHCTWDEGLLKCFDREKHTGNLAHLFNEISG